MKPRTGRFQPLAKWLFLLVVILAVFSARVISEGESELSSSDAAFDRGDLEQALDHARRSATLYAPGAPHVTRAYERLEALALGAEAAGKAKVARSAWQAVRSAALESRHLWLSRPRELDRANQNLARLETLSGDVSVATGGDTQKQRNRALSRLNADDAPEPAWIAVLGLGFLLALAGLGSFAFHGLDASGKVSLNRARLGVVLFLIGAACWTIAAYRA